MTTVTITRSVNGIVDTQFVECVNTREAEIYVTGFQAALLMSNMVTGGVCARWYDLTLYTKDEAIIMITTNLPQSLRK